MDLFLFKVGNARFFQELPSNNCNFNYNFKISTGFPCALAKSRHDANINAWTSLYCAIIYPFLIYSLLARGSMFPTT